MQDLLTAISDVFSMKAVQSKIQSCKQGKIKITPDIKGIALLPFDIIPISTEGILYLPYVASLFMILKLRWPM